MRSIRWSSNPEDVDVQMELAVAPGAVYKLQLLFLEACCSRGFDVNIDGVLDCTVSDPAGEEHRSLQERSPPNAPRP